MFITWKSISLQNFRNTEKEKLRYVHIEKNEQKNIWRNLIKNIILWISITNFCILPYNTEFINPIGKHTICINNVHFCQKKKKIVKQYICKFIINLIIIWNIFQIMHVLFITCILLKLIFFNVFFSTNKCIFFMKIKTTNNKSVSYYYKISTLPLALQFSLHMINYNNYLNINTNNIIFTWYLLFAYLLSEL